jgi:hypothetical protein
MTQPRAPINSASTECLRFPRPAPSPTGGGVAPLRATRTPSPAVPQAPANEPAGAVAPGQATPAPAGSDFPREQFLKEARAL